jgi:DNA-binding GntR family transcriptional regulator
MFVAIHKTLRQLVAQNAQGEPYKQKVEHHRRIYAAIRSRDPELAAKCMCSHLEHALAMFVRQAQKRAQRTRKDTLNEQLRPINQPTPMSRQLRTLDSIT